MIYIVFFSASVLYYFSPAVYITMAEALSPAVYITIDRSIVEGSGLLGIVPA